jgi:glucose/arabinose dehydrogenase
MDIHTDTDVSILPRRLRLSTFIALILFTGLTGCINQPQMLPLSKQKIIDRNLVEYPSGFALVPVVEGLDQPTAIAFDGDGSLLVAESGMNGSEPHIFGYHRDGSYFNIYPYKRTVSFYPTGFVLYGPIGGMVAYQGKIYVSHRDRQGKGVITALGYDGSHSTVVADLPAQGDYGVTDLLIRPGNGRLYFGVGTATNSGVVGVDNWDEGWLKKFPDVHDVPYRRAPNSFTYLLGRRFDTPNPRAGLFGGADIAVTAPFQPFDVSNQTQIPGSPDKPNGAIFSVNPDGGDLRVEAFGIHDPRGLGINEYDILYMTNDGMQLRGTRPVQDDPDALLRVGIGVWYGWPDYTADCRPVSERRFQPPERMLIKTGYPDLSFIIDHDTSGLHPPDPSVLVAGSFPSLSGAAKFDFVPPAGPFKEYRGSAIVALDGDRAPFATSGKKLLGPVGFQVCRVDLDHKQVKPFIRNTAGVPASMQAFGTVALERPIDVKFGPDGALYILDFGRMDNKTGIPRLFNGTGRIFKLVSLSEASTRGAK